MEKIIFGITSLTLGGAERVLVDLANELSKTERYEITIFTIYSQGELEKQVSSKIIIKSIFNKKYNELTKIQKKVIIPLQILLGKNKIYKKYVKNKYDKEIAFLEGPITRIFSCGNEKQKKIAWVHNDIAQVFGTGVKASLKKKIDEKLYDKFNQLIFVSKNNLESFEKIYTNNKSNRQVIYNYINAQKILKEAEEPIVDKFINFGQNYSKTTLLEVARLVPQKALDRLIKIHAKLINEGMPHNLYIIGEGPEKARLQELIKNEKCESTVKLLGKKENPYPYMKMADYICLLSEFEGYGMVLEEAKILNKNILITDTAAKEAIQNYDKSKIFENSNQGIYNGLKQVLKKTEKTEPINAPKEEKYDNFCIVEQVEKVLEEYH